MKLHLQGMCFNWNTGAYYSAFPNLSTFPHFLLLYCLSLTRISCLILSFTYYSFFFSELTALQVPWDPLNHPRITTAYNTGFLQGSHTTAWWGYSEWCGSVVYWVTAASHLTRSGELASMIWDCHIMPFKVECYSPKCVPICFAPPPPPSPPFWRFLK